MYLCTNIVNRKTDIELILSTNLKKRWCQFDFLFFVCLLRYLLLQLWIYLNDTFDRYHS